MSPSDWDDDDEKTVMGWLDTPDPKASASKDSPDEDDEKTVIGVALPLSGRPSAPPAPPVKTQPAAPLQTPPAASGDDDRTVFGTPLPKVDAPKDEDEDRTVIAPLPMPGTGKTQPPIPAPKPPAAEEDEDKTVFAPLPPVANPFAAKTPPSEADDDPWGDGGDDDKTVFAPLPAPAAPAAPRAATAIQKFIPREAWTPEETVEQALLGHSLEKALRHAARRSPNGLSAAQRDSLVQQASQRLKNPSDAFLEDDLLATFRQLVAARAEDLAMHELDREEPEMPSGLDPDEQQQWKALGKGLFVLLRELERRAGDKPRIGRNIRVHDQIVKLGQDPFSGVPHAEINRYDPSKKVPVIRAQFMGFFGPFGAFPLNWTEEVQHWFRHGDKSFVAFVDIFTQRFQELFFRAWSDAHAITQFDHPTDDRFQDYLLSITGNGTPAMQERDAVSDTVKARYAGLAGGRVKSPTRLRQILQLHFDGKLDVEIEELVPTWLDFEPDTLSHLGQQACGMGMNMHLGSRVRTVGEKIRVHLYVRSIKDYFDLLPSGADHDQLRDLIFWYLGEAYEIETVLWLPQPEIQPAVMGVNAQLGWMACIAPPKGDPDKMVQVTVFTLLPPKGENQKEAA